MPGCSSALPATTNADLRPNCAKYLIQMVSSSTSLNICSPVQAARSHPKCIGSLLASDGTDGCVGCEATPEIIEFQTIFNQLPNLLTTESSLGIVLIQDVQVTQLHPGFLKKKTYSSTIPNRNVDLVRHEDLQVLVELSHGASTVALSLEDGNLSLSST